MSTRINVTVGDGGLLDRNAQQTAANRQARVLADQRATAEAEGVERRAADRIAAGLDPLTGLPASTPSSASTINRLDQEPAANRRGGLSIAHTWQLTEVTTALATSGLYGSWDGFATFINVGQIPGPIVTGVRHDVAIGSGDASFWLPLVFDTGGRVIPGGDVATNPDGTLPAGIGTYTFIANGVVNFNTNASVTGFLLPAGRKLSLLTLIHAYSYYDINRTTTLDVDENGFGRLVDNAGTATLVGAAAERTYRTFLIGEKTVREIAVPEPYLSVLHAEFPPANTTRVVREGGLTTAQAFTIPAFGTRTIPNGTLTATIDPYYSIGATPQVFKRINAEFDNLLPEEQIKDTPLMKRYPLRDVNRGGFAILAANENNNGLKNAYAAGEPFFYARWPVLGQSPTTTPGLPILAQPSATLRLSPGRPAYPEELQLLQLYTATDWDDPRYCRAYLTALGFTAADLTP
jgi:hypothetical protein